jgi:hypothetical protein
LIIIDNTLIYVLLFFTIKTTILLFYSKQYKKDK